MSNDIFDDLYNYQYIYAVHGNSNQSGTISIGNGTNTNPTTTTTIGTGTGTGLTYPTGTLSSPTWAYLAPTEPTYTVLRLPKSKMPEKIFVMGMLKTCGLLGTDAECAYDGHDNLVFSPNVLPTTNGYQGYISVPGYPNSSKPTISLEYSDAIYHYVVDYVPAKGENTILQVRQIGVVKKEK